MSGDEERVDLLAALQRSIDRHRDSARAVRTVRTATKPASEGQDTRERISEPLRLDPSTSLSMTYLREFERTHSTMRGQVRLARKAGHMLRMHWAHVRAGSAQ